MSMEEIFKVIRAYYSDFLKVFNSRRYVTRLLFEKTIEKMAITKRRSDLIKSKNSIPIMLCNEQI